MKPEKEFEYLWNSKVRNLKMKDGKTPYIINFISKEDREKLDKNLDELLKNVKNIKKMEKKLTVDDILKAKSIIENQQYNYNKDYIKEYTISKRIIKGGVFLNQLEDDSSFYEIDNHNEILNVYYKSNKIGLGYFEKIQIDGNYDTYLNIVIWYNSSDEKDIYEGKYTLGCIVNLIKEEEIPVFCAKTREYGKVNVRHINIDDITFILTK